MHERDVMLWYKLDSAGLRLGLQVELYERYIETVFYKKWGSFIQFSNYLLLKEDCSEQLVTLQVFIIQRELVGYIKYRTWKVNTFLKSEYDRQHLKCDQATAQCQIGVA